MRVEVKPGTTHAFNRARSPQLVVFLFALALLLSAAPPVYAAADPIEVGYRGPSYPGSAGGNGSPTGEKPESKLWWHDGYWWASMWSGGSNGAYHIYRLDAGNINSEAWTDTGVELDNRQDSRADVLSDGNTLYVASHVFAKDAGESSTNPDKRGRLYRYSYDSGAQTYRLDEGDGFPVEVTGGVSETLVLEKDAQGKLWVTYVEDQKVMVNHSVQGDDTNWVGPYPLPVSDAENLNSDDISSIITYNVYVGIMWSKQRSGQRMYFAVHHTGNSDNVWDQVLTFNQGDDHINLTALESDGNGRVYGVVKTSGNEIVLLACELTADYCRDEGNWSAHTVFDDHNPTRAMMLLDTHNHDLYVFSRNREGGRDGIYYKRTDMDAIQFDGSIGTPFIKSAENNEDGINDPTSTKQNLTGASGLMVLASDSGVDRYFYNYMSLSGDQTEYELEVNVDGEGSVTPDGGTYEAGTEVALTATAADGWQFTGWSGALTGDTNPATLTMDGNKIVTATFTVDTPTLYTLEVKIEGEGSVTPDGGTYEAGTEVTLTATADVGSQFIGWSDDLNGSDNPTTIVMDGDKTVTATFMQDTPTLYTLTVKTDGPGTVEVDPPGGPYPQGSDVLLTAVPAENWAFGGWGGDLTGNTNPITLTMDSDKTITASFFWPEHLLTVNTLGSGSVTLDPPGGPYIHGEEVTLTAVAEPGWTFHSWSGDLTGTENPATVVMDAAKEINATFVQKESRIEIKVSATPLTATVGQVITYTYVVANIGEATLNDIAAVDDRLGVVTLGKTTLAGGETAMGRLTYTPVMGDLPGPLANNATVTATSVLDEELFDDDAISVALVQLPFVYYMPLAFSAAQATTSQIEHQAMRSGHDRLAVLPAATRRLTGGR